MDPEAEKMSVQEHLKALVAPEAQALIPAVEAANAELLKKSNIDLDHLKVEGYSPYTTDGQLLVAPVGEDETQALLLVQTPNEVKASLSDSGHHSKLHPVIGGNAELRVTITEEQSDLTDNRKEWVVTDIRGGQVEKQVMTKHEVPTLKGVEVSYDSATIKIGDEDVQIRPPEAFGYAISATPEAKPQVVLPPSTIQKIL